MTTLTTATRVANPAARPYPVTGVLRSEWTKLRSVRSTYWTLISTVVAMVGISVVAGLQTAHSFRENPLKTEGTDVTSLSLNGLFIAQLLIGTLGVVVVSSEYGTGMIRTSLAAVPQRRSLLLAKLGVFLTCVFVIGQLVSFPAFFIGQAIMHAAGGASLSDPHVLRAVVGSGLYLTAVALLGVSLGALIRHTAGGVTTLFGLLFLPSALVDLLPTHLRNDVIPYMPANSGSQIFTVIPSHDALAPWTGFGVFCLYGVVVLLLALEGIRRRDA